MAENNQNWNNRSNQDWDRNRNRFNQQDENRNRENYGNVNYGSDYRQNQGMQGNYGQRDYGGAYSSDYGSQYGRGQGGYGNRSDIQGQGSWQSQGSNYGNRRESDWTRNRGAIGSAGMYGGDFGREEPERRDIGSGDDLRTGYSSNYGSQYGYGNYGNRMGASGSSSGNYIASQNHNYTPSGENSNRGWWDRTKDEVSSWLGNEDVEQRRNNDEQQSGYRGRGPKGYQRSQERIKEDVCDRLSDDDWLDASDIEVQVQGDEVILTGSVNSREDKRRAEDLVESIHGVRNVENRIRVGRGEDAFSNRTMNTSTYSSGITGGNQTSGSETTGSERSRKK